MEKNENTAKATKTTLTDGEKANLELLTRVHLAGRPGPKATGEISRHQNDTQPLAKQLRPETQPYVPQRKEQDAAAALNIGWINRLKPNAEESGG
jgi:hypothetical protein